MAIEKQVEREKRTQNTRMLQRLLVCALKWMYSNLWVWRIVEKNERVIEEMGLRWRNCVIGSLPA